MTSINLSQSVQTTGATRKKSFGDKSFYISLALLIITGIVFGILKFTTANYVSKKESVDSQIEQELRGFDGKDADRVADFQKRVEKVERKLSAVNDPNETLRKIGQAMVSGATIDSFEQEELGIVLKIKTDNFLTAAKQILGFKKIQGLNNVQMTEISRDMDGKIMITMQMTL